MDNAHIHKTSYIQSYWKDSYIKLLMKHLDVQLSSKESYLAIENQTMGILVLYTYGPTTL